MSKSFLSTMKKISREIEKSSRATAREKERQLRNQMRTAREAERAQRAYERSLAAEEKVKKKLYLESRLAEVDNLNEILESKIEALSTLLISAIDKDTKIDFNSLLITPEIPPFELGGLDTFPLPPKKENYLPAKLNKLIAWINWFKKRHENKLIQAEKLFLQKMKEHEEAVNAQQLLINQKRLEYDEQVKAIRSKAEAENTEIKNLADAFEAGNPEAITAYFQLVLMNSEYPTEFSKKTKIFYIDESKQLLVEYELPEIETIIPTAKLYKYIKSNDKIAETPRPDSQRKALYLSVIAQIVIRCLYELFKADEKNYLESIVLNGFIDTIDKSTGNRVRPCIVTVLAVKDDFNSLDLAHVEPTACLSHLHASVSKSPSELAPVRPILELNMVDSRFIQETDVLSTIDQRQNLMELSPSEFESLITNLFQTMGLETKLTQPSRDGGVDCVAFDPRPIFGGKVIIQAKRYKNTVGVSAVRDLFGTMQNEGASKGILVTTSGYGKAAYNFANGKPIELLSGSNLLYLLKEHADLDAKIIIPDDWKDSFSE